MVTLYVYFYFCPPPEQILQFYSPITVSWLPLHIPAQWYHRGLQKGFTLIWLILLMAILALFSIVWRPSLWGKKDVPPSNRPGSVLDDTGISTRDSIFFEQSWSPRHGRLRANGEALHPGTTRQVTWRHFLWFICFHSSEEFFVQLQRQAQTETS